MDPKELLTTDRRKLLLTVALILTLAAFLRFYNIGWSYSNNGVDEGIMLQRALLVSEGYGLYTELPCDQAPMAFYLGALLDGEVVPLRAMSASLSMLAVAACMLAARKLAGDKAMILTGLMLAVDFVFVRESRLFSLDAMSASFFAFSILALAYYVKGESRLALVVAGLMVGVSTSVKLLGVVPLLGMIAFFAVTWVLDRKVTRRKAIDLGILVAVSAVPLGLFALLLGPSDILQGTVFDQGHREFEPFLKLSIVAFLGLNIPYVLPLVYARRQWRCSPETRFLIVIVLVVLAFMIVQPLVFLHHMVMLSPPLAVLAGVLVARRIDREKCQGQPIRARILSEKGIGPGTAFLVVIVAGLCVSSGFGLYGLAAQEKPTQVYYGEFVASLCGPDDWVVSGDPIIASYAGVRVPPELANVGYRQYPDLTLDRIEDAIIGYNVSVVVLCYRLNEFSELPAFLEAHGYEQVAAQRSSHSQPPASSAALDLFQEGLGDITVYVRMDVASAHGL